MAGDSWWSGDWELKLGAEGYVAPRFSGSKSYMLMGRPLISLGKAGPEARFVSRNDNISFSLYDEGMVRAGLTGKLVLPRKGSDDDALKGLSPVKLGAEVGGFAEVYPTDWLRLRTEIRRGIRSHQGIVGDVAIDAFTDVTPTIRVSAGPRLHLASQDYMNAYYGVNARESAKSGLKRYSPKGGVESAGIGSEINWKATEKVDTSLFAEYKRLMGPAADSSLVRERGSKNQFVIGVSATYRFGFSLD